MSLRLTENSDPVSPDANPEMPLFLPGEIRWLAAAAALLLLGLGAAFGERAGERLSAPLFLLGGGALLAWQGSLVLRRWQAERARQRAAAQKAALRMARRERVLREREHRRAVRAAAAEAVLRLQEKRVQQNQAIARRTEEATARRAEQDRAVADWAKRLLHLSDTELIAEVTDVFARRRQHPQMPDPEAECDLLLTAINGSTREVARCVPQGQQAGARDIQALEAWRQEARADHAYLIALAGFTPGAIRLAQSLPLTLVEAHLLAHWKMLRQDSSGEFYAFDYRSTQRHDDTPYSGDAPRDGGGGGRR